MSRPSPVRLEFPTSEFNALPMSPRLRERLAASASAKPSSKKMPITMKVNLASAKANSHLLAKKAVAKKFIRRVELVRHARQRKAGSLQAKLEERNMEAALRRFTTRREKLEKLEKHSEKVDRISLDKLKKELTAPLAKTREIQTRLSEASLRRAESDAARVAAAAKDVRRAAAVSATVAAKRQEALLQRTSTIEKKLAAAEERRNLSLAKSLRSPAKGDVGLSAAMDMSP